MPLQLVNYIHLILDVAYNWYWQSTEKFIPITSFWSTSSNGMYMYNVLASTLKWQNIFAELVSASFSLGGVTVPTAS